MTTGEAQILQAADAFEASYMAARQLVDRLAPALAESRTRKPVHVRVTVRGLREVRAN